MQKLTLLFVALAGLIAMAMAQPVEQLQANAPALDSVGVQASSHVEAVRKARQLGGTLSSDYLWSSAD